MIQTHDPKTHEQGYKDNTKISLETAPENKNFTKTKIS